ncbi:MAG: hypothetical protein CL920_10005 [Deltaproteobacteria bacterium]|nr:hypothetical protein [Deltaproteobacteria bacterium]MBU49016.1 hypothetical protein [Deltaproteobacteria bacterium]|tara:strand:- start:21212 stop:22405 length:1194 start_codon:yes stop_codon:yes gene_type:complete
MQKKNAEEQASTSSTQQIHERTEVDKDNWSCLLAEEDQEQTYAALVRKYAPEPVSWNQARKLIHTGKVFLDGGRLSNPANRYNEGKRLEVRMSEPRRALSGELEASRILYIDKDVVLVNKPAGMLTVSYAEIEDLDTLEILLRGTIQRIRKGRFKDPLHLVHRLDKLSSGVLIFARTKEAFKHLKEQFADHSIGREYRAVVVGHPENGTVRSWLVEDRGDGYKGSVPKKDAKKKYAKEAITHIEVLEQFTHASLLSCRLETGRTHQIRIHLSEMGHPLIGDQVYLKACARRGRIYEELPDFDRVALHARSLTFIHPTTGKEMSFNAPIPRDIKQLLKDLREETKEHGVEIADETALEEDGLPPVSMSISFEKKKKKIKKPPSIKNKSTRRPKKRRSS